MKMRVICTSMHFYPRSPCGERLVRVCEFVWGVSISINALLAESDLDPLANKAPFEISIHALLAESDRASPFSIFWICHFYPRSPCGERQWEGMKSLSEIEFLSTLSLRRATTGQGVDGSGKGYFYPRSPCGERHVWQTQKHQHIHFYPRSPCGERRAPSPPRQKFYKISIHALLAESDKTWSHPRHAN